jgi:hypothetical protein
MERRRDPDGIGGRADDRNSEIGWSTVRLSEIRSISDIATRIRENWVGYVREYRVFLVLVVLASLADMASTVYFMVYAGPDAEFHPTVRFVSEFLGPFLGPMLGKAIQLTVVIVLTVFLRRQAIFIFIPVIILYTWAAWYNVWGYQLYYPRLLRILEHLAI